MKAIRTLKNTPKNSLKIGIKMIPINILAERPLLNYIMLDFLGF